MRDWKGRTRSRRRNTRPGVTIGRGKVSNRLASHQVVRQGSLFNHRHALRRNAFIVELIMSEERFSAVGRDRGIVNHGKKIGKHAAFITGCKCPGRALVLTQLWSASENILTDQIGKHGGRSVG